ncbi:MAG: ATP-binding cassette domain-containing protein [Clostridia bacterium]|nr:ATP-binding cassette domain-containing protein [Clostridia bacterium]
MFRLTDVSFSYDDKKVLSDFSLSVENGECAALCGPSGCGKTTAAMILARLLKADSGEVTSPERISVVFQEDRLIEGFSVIKNIRLCLYEKDYAFAESLLKEVGLYEQRSKKVRELSGGMKRRVSIVRAVAFGGEGLILDEAFNGIDKDNKVICAAIIKREFIDKGKPVLMISHSAEDINLFDCKKIDMRNGE